MHSDINKTNIGNTNIGNTDRMIREIVGVLLIISLFLGGGWGLGLIGAALIGTGALRFCPVYKLFGFSTNTEATVPIGK